ncbi:MAG: extracellular solute-binding protein [Hyphomonas sp.]
MPFRPAILVGAACLILSACSQDTSAPATAGPAVGSNGIVNLYSARHYDSDKLMYKAFEEATGIKVRYRESGAAELLETMNAEAENSPADVIISSDAGTLYRFQAAGHTQAIDSPALNAAIPERLREENGNWFGLAKRVRVIAYDPTRLSADQVDEYADLASDALTNEVCMRSSTNIYNLSLMGELIDRMGSEGAESWTQSVVNNFARPPQGGDMTQIQSIAAGECSAALVNHYYWVRMSVGSKAQQAAAAKTKLSFPNQSTTGTHVNVTGAAVAAHAPNKENAIKFIEFLATPTGQELLTRETKEFPVIAAVTFPEGLEQLPEFKQSDFPLERLGKNQAEAQAIFDRAGWN